MVSTRQKGSPILMLDDHGEPVQQSSAPLANPSKKRSKKSATESTKQQSGKPAELKSSRSTRNNPNPDEEEVEQLSEPERLLQKRPGSRKARKDTRQPKTTNPEKDVYNLPSSDGESETARARMSPGQKISSRHGSSRSEAIEVKVKGRNIRLKVPKNKPASTNVEIVGQRTKDTHIHDHTAEGEDGDDENDEDDAADGDDTLGGIDANIIGEVEDEEQNYDPEQEPEEEPEEEFEEESEEKTEQSKRRLGTPFEGQRDQTGIRADKTKHQKDERNGKKKKRRKDIGTFYGDIDDSSESDENVLREMSLEGFKHRFTDRAIAMEQEFTIAFSNVENDRKSIKRRLKALDHVILETVDEFNEYGIFDEVFKGGRYHDRYKPLPRILPGDPFPEGAADFNPQHPAVKALFSDEKAAYQVDMFDEHLEHVESALAAAKRLHKIAEKIFVASEGYKTVLSQHQKFLQDCRQHAKTVKARYISRRVADAEIARKLQEEKLARLKALQQEDARRQAYNARYSPNKTPLVRKRTLVDVPDTIDPKRQKLQHQSRSSGEHRPPPSESYSSEGLRTPPPADRVVIELFGDHTPGRARRYQNPKSPTDLAAGSRSGIHDDDAPWTAEENDALDAALREYQDPETRWVKIKKYYGAPGTLLAERSCDEIRQKAIEYKTRIKTITEVLPDYWELVD